MTIYDWVAILGALAWTPHLVQWVLKQIQKPTIQIITSKAVELGFTSYGPIFNFDLAFAVQHKDIVVTSLRVIITHQAGEEKSFEWKAVKQHIMQMQTPDGSKLPYHKEHSVLAIKLTQKDIEERFIQFQSPAFSNKKFAQEDTVLENITYEKENNTFVPEKVMQSQEMQNLINFIKQEFSWKSGKYEIEIEIGSTEKFQITGNKYEFTLTPLHISKLEKNKEMIEPDYDNIISSYKEVKETNKDTDKDEVEVEDSKKKVKWNWVNPVLIKLN